MRILSIILLTLCLAGCNRGLQNKEAVRQGVLEHLKGANFNLTSMDVAVEAVQFNGNKADATVSFTPKGGQGMTLQYQLELQGSKWVVLARKDSGGAPHAGVAPGTMSATPAGENPHGGAAGAAPGAAPAAGNPHGGAAMPSPDSLPPAGSKK